MLISSELPEILHMSDRLLVIKDHEVTVELDPKQTTQEEIMSYITKTKSKQTDVTS